MGKMRWQCVEKLDCLLSPESQKVVPQFPVATSEPVAQTRMDKAQYRSLKDLVHGQLDPGDRGAALSGRYPGDAYLYLVRQYRHVFRPPQSGFSDQSTERLGLTTYFIYQFR